MHGLRSQHHPHSLHGSHTHTSHFVEVPLDTIDTIDIQHPRHYVVVPLDDQSPALMCAWVGG